MLLVGSAVVVLLVRRKDAFQDTSARTITALKELLAARDLQLAEKSKELEILTAEHKQLIQVGVKEMVSGWTAFSSSHVLRENMKLRTQLEEQRVICSQCQTYIEGTMIKKHD